MCAQKRLLVSKMLCITPCQDIAVMNLTKFKRLDFFENFPLMKFQKEGTKPIISKFSELVLLNNYLAIPPESLDQNFGGEFFWKLNPKF